MGNYVIVVRKYVIVSLSELGNYMIADSSRPPPVVRAAARRSGGSTVQIRGSGIAVRPAPGRNWLTCYR